MSPNRRERQRLERAKDEFARLCRSRGLSLMVWVGHSYAYNAYAVCYCGPLGDCERAENACLAQSVQKLYKSVHFAYSWPAPADAERTYGGARGV